MIDVMNGSIPASMNAGLNLVHVDDVPADRWFAFEPERIGERYLPGSQHLTLRGILPGIAHITGGRAPTFRIRHALTAFLPSMNEGVIPVAERGTPRAGIDAARMSEPGTFFTCEKARKGLGLAPQPATEALRDEIH